MFEKYPELDSAAGGYQDTDSGVNVMKPQIAAIDDSNLSAMSDVHDGHHTGEMSVDALTNLTETVSKSARQVANSIKDKGDSAARQIWSGFLDDLLGPKARA